MKIDLNSCVLVHISHYHQPPGIHPRPAEIPPHYERIEWVTGGRGWVFDGDDWREVKPGDLLWNRPGDYTIGRSDFGNPYRCLSITLKSERAEGHDIPRFSFWPDREEVVDFTSESIKFFADESFDRQVLLNYIVSRVLFCIHACQRQEGKELPAAIRLALDWIRKNYPGRCSVGQIARVAGWSPAHLHHSFVRHLGITPHQAVLRERMRAARERLVSSPEPVKRIAVECGFGDAASFTHGFKATTGMTPGAFRKRYLSLDGVGEG